MSHPRPILVSLACYLLIIGALLKFGFYIFAVGDLRLARYWPAPWIAAMIVVDCVVAGGCAYYMLRGANWARIVYYAGYGTGALILLIFQCGALSIGSMATYLVFGAVFATPTATQFFTGKVPHGKTPRRNDRSRDESRPRRHHEDNRFDY